MKKIILVLTFLLFTSLTHAAVTKLYYCKVLSSYINAMGGIKFTNTAGITILLNCKNDGTYHYFIVELTGANSAALGKWLNDDLLPYAGDYAEYVEVSKGDAKYLSVLSVKP